MLHFLWQLCFAFSYLANDVEEDEEEMKYEIFPWALGKKWKDKYPYFLKKRDKLLRLIDYKAIVSRRCSDEVLFGSIYIYLIFFTYPQILYMFLVIMAHYLFISCLSISVSVCLSDVFFHFKLFVRHLGMSLC